MYTQHIVSPTHSCICSPSHSSSLTSVTVTHCLSLIHHPSPHGYSLLFYSFFLSHTLIDSFSPSLVLSVTHVSVSFSAVVSLIPLIQIIIVLTRFISLSHYLTLCLTISLVIFLSHLLPLSLSFLLTSLSSDPPLTLFSPPALTLFSLACIVTSHSLTASLINRNLSHPCIHPASYSFSLSL